MLATDAGIAAHLPYLKTLMQGRLEASIRTRRVVVIWQVQDSNHDKWVKKWFDKLLPNDTSFMLEIRIHSPGNGQYRPTSGSDRPINLLPGDVIAAGQHDLIKLIALPAHFEQVLDQERNRDGRGKLLVSVCVDARSRASLRRTIAEQVDPDVQYHEHEYQVPDKSRRSLVLDEKGVLED
ncbi:hypothetical protein LTR99_010957 [Exophiala xenobiotica]|uniref:Uncharacterized protein n=1 Tax=Vermiconidia calcicola TaxID=1690605 RepID=A0AAV9QIR7_9PEZI|nr:hypothetical protein LTR99_010957 [Exophiala xenobiotica]KAK5430802.1 hypothetical protein LTR34_005361 [Exophiala xenobiotica]KAK5541359.1 hypothetical protein LTR25_003136 [Vermiconidia calcicola]